LSFYAKILIGFKKYILNKVISLGLLILFCALFVSPVSVDRFIFLYIVVTSILLSLTWGYLFYLLGRVDIHRYNEIIWSSVKIGWASRE
jgi:hypothetical protein